MSTWEANYYVIGRQISTDFGGIIDLLCLDRNGELIVIELKRAKTPRDIVAQLLDYASWAKDLSYDKIMEIANDYFGKSGSLEDAFQNKFGMQLPESLNISQRPQMLIVASQLDDSTERIVNYLSETYGIGINAATFHCFRKDNKQYLARVFVIEPELADIRSKPPGRRQRLTENELQEIAERNGVRELYSELVAGLTPLFSRKGTTLSSLAFIGVQDEKENTIFSLIPDESEVNQGLKFRAYLRRFSRFFNIDEDTAKSILPTNKREYTSSDPEYSGYEGFFRNADEIKYFLAELKRRKA